MTSISDLGGGFKHFVFKVFLPECPSSGDLVSTNYLGVAVISVLCHGFDCLG